MSLCSENHKDLGGDDETCFEDICIHCGCCRWIRDETHVSSTCSVCGEYYCYHCAYKHCFDCCEDGWYDGSACKKGEGKCKYCHRRLCTKCVTYDDGICSDCNEKFQEENK